MCEALSALAESLPQVVEKEAELSTSAALRKRGKRQKRRKKKRGKRGKKRKNRSTASLRARVSCVLEQAQTGGEVGILLHVS